LGYLDQARARLARTVALSAELLLPANLADCNSYISLCYHLLCDPLKVQCFAEPALQICTEKGFPYPRIMATLALGWSLVMQGRIAEGCALARQGMASAQEYGQRLKYSQLVAMLAEALLVAGQSAEAIDVLDEGIARFEQYHDLLAAPDLWRLRGEALLALTRDDGAVERCYQEALSLARQLGAKVSELRAGVALGRFWQRQGKVAAAHAQLAALYDWFSEGLDTPDLQEASALLAELAALLG
jgi:predicted ATPase